mmetsp:Transcript_24031/g.33078  ORF Transcript_24031/g.33078 Transcript_24031/m.33078 type:complete len:476 (+) Transcript_24031:158-1585(+)|eukprot:CAMPEP_0196592014 /NCGR_PEP_ID=MMETSP1081-20130531/71579_1 /TAXON_ID=36882 /ORGANISM="Pyramimonas amylifera, Strain CCMP720" /LENGTH=475 /DNA_ID=CAMNT_0041915569 /DNA_START=158 /DNA_END=1585 /DNA_ORIENTATION=-
MWYLCYFMHRHLGFRREEVQALADAFGCGSELEWGLPHGGSPDSPFWYINLPSEEHARQIASRSCLVKGIYEVWGEGATLDEMLTACQSFPLEQKTKYFAPEIVFKICIESFGMKIPQKTQMEYIRKLDAKLPFEGKVDLKAPDHRFWLIQAVDPVKNCNVSAIVPPRWYFGREIATGDRSPMPNFELSNRRYIGPTSMDVELAVIMCNMVGARRGRVVYDPFTGTGSILVAAAHFQATTLGSDIDIRVLRDGKTNKAGEQVDVWGNFNQYGLEAPVGLLRFDAHRPPFRAGLEEFLDAIVCDPPYGVRAGGRKSGGRKAVPTPIPDGLREGHIPSTAPYGLPECLYDLLHFASLHLRVQGRLCFWLPCATEVYTETDIPSHPALRLCANSEQILTRRWSRRLITMEKLRPFDHSSPHEVPTIDCPALVAALEGEQENRHDQKASNERSLRDHVMKPDREAKPAKKIPMYRSKNV